MRFLRTGDPVTIKSGDHWLDAPTGAIVELGVIDAGPGWAPAPETVESPSAPREVAGDDLGDLDLDELLTLAESEGADIGAASTVNGVTRKIRDNRNKGKS